MPWLLDLLGNRFGLFDAVSWRDDAMPYLNWLLLTAGVLRVWGLPSRTGRGVVVVMVALGFGATAAVLWELGEYAAFVRTSPEFATAYADTLGDLALGTAGALTAGLALGRLRAGGLGIGEGREAGGYGDGHGGPMPDPRRGR